MGTKGEKIGEFGETIVLVADNVAAAGDVRIPAAGQTGSKRFENQKRTEKNRKIYPDGWSLLWGEWQNSRTRTRTRTRRTNGRALNGQLTGGVLRLDFRPFGCGRQIHPRR